MALDVKPAAIIARPALDSRSLDQLFREARTHHAWQRTPIDDATLRELYELSKWGPTAVNSNPMRLVFLRSDLAKQRLVPALSPGNVAQTLAAPVTVIVAYDSRFYDQLPALFPHADARAWYVDNTTLAQETALRNGSLQGAYLILAARALGLDAGPMSGFDNAALDAEFFADGRWKSNFLVNLGYGESTRLHERGPRLEFSQAAQIL